MMEKSHNWRSSQPGRHLPHPPSFNFCKSATYGVLF
jgi:hypothetical protein